MTARWQQSHQNQWFLLFDMPHFSILYLDNLQTDTKFSLTNWQLFDSVGMELEFDRIMLNPSKWCIYYWSYMWGEERKKESKVLKKVLCFIVQSSNMPEIKKATYWVPRVPNIWSNGKCLRLGDVLASWEVVFLWQSWTRAPDSADLRQEALQQLLISEV